MPANLLFKSSDGLTTVTTATFTDVDPGTPSAALALRLLNDGGPDTAPSPLVVLNQINSSNEAVKSGIRAIDEHWLEFRAVGGGSTGSTQIATGWEPLGNLRDFALAALASDEYHSIELRYNPAGSAPEGEVSFVLDVLEGPQSSTTANGLTESTRDGVLSGLGDDYYDEILFGGDASEASVPDDTVEYTNLQYLVDGKRYAELAGAVTLNGDDSTSTALVSGEYYWAVLTLGPSGITTTKSLALSAPADTALVPDPPDGEIPWLRVYRDFDAVINDADITVLTPVGQFQQVVSGTSLAVGPGRARIGNRVVRKTTATPLSLTTNDTNRTWLLPDGSLTVNQSATAPSLRAYLLWTHVTDGSGVTATTDHREPIGGDLVPVKFEFATVPDAAESYALHPLRRDAYVLPERSAVVMAGGTPSGNTTGQCRWDLEYRPPGGSWASIFTATANQPGISIDEGEHTGAFADVLLIPAGSALRATNDLVSAYDGTAPTNVLIALLLEVA